MELTIVIFIHWIVVFGSCLELGTCVDEPINKILYRVLATDLG